MNTGKVKPGFLGGGDQIRPVLVDHCSCDFCYITLSLHNFNSNFQEKTHFFPLEKQPVDTFQVSLHSSKDLVQSSTDKYVCDYINVIVQDDCRYHIYYIYCTIDLDNKNVARHACFNYLEKMRLEEKGIARMTG